MERNIDALNIKMKWRIEDNEYYDSPKLPL